MHLKSIAVLHLELEILTCQHVHDLPNGLRHVYAENRRVVDQGKTNRIWCVRGLNSRSVKEKSDGTSCLALTFAKGAHQLLKFGGALNLEKDFVVVIRHLNVEVFRVGRGLLAGCTVRILVRHYW